MKTIKYILLMMFLLCAPVDAGDISRSHDFLDGEVLTAALLDTAFDEIVNEVNDLDGANLASNIEITTSGNITGTGTTVFSGAFSATGTSNTIGDGGSDALTLDLPGGISLLTSTWTITGQQTVNGTFGTWSDLGTVNDVNIDGGTFSDVTFDGTWDASGVTVTNLGTVATVDMNGGTIDNVIIGSSLATNAFFEKSSQYEARFTETPSDPVTATNEGSFYTKAVSAITEFFLKKENDGDAIQITSGGRLYNVTGMQIFTTANDGAGVFTVPTGVTTVYVTQCGSGGGGGAGKVGGGGGGSAGASVIMQAHTVTPGASLDVSVGAGGTAGASRVSAGGNGNSTTFDSAITTPGGLGGTLGGDGTGGAAVAATGAGGNNSGATGGVAAYATLQGWAGGDGTAGAGNGGGAGGSSYLGIGGAGGDDALAGLAGSGFCSGGGGGGAQGGADDEDGGVGADGVSIVMY